jgi:succinate dehydrogenase/fumarate reductase cytochrome b subunit
LQPYRGTIAWLVQRLSAIALVFLVPLKMYTGYAMSGKLPWPSAKYGPETFHANTIIDITILLCLFLHAFYGIRVILMDLGWIREDRWFWRATILALGMFALSIYWLYIRQVPE